MLSISDNSPQNCAACHAENPATARFCGQCGAPLRFTDSTPAPIYRGEESAPSPQPNDQVVCTWCKTVNQSTTGLCQGCGLPLKQSPTARRVSQSRVFDESPTRPIPATDRDTDYTTGEKQIPTDKHSDLLSRKATPTTRKTKSKSAHRVSQSRVFDESPTKTGLEQIGKNRFRSHLFLGVMLIVGVLFILWYVRHSQPTGSKKTTQLGETALPVDPAIIAAQINQLMTSGNPAQVLTSLINLGNTAFDSAHYQTAIIYYVHALSLDSSAVDVRVDLGAAYHALDDNQKALEQFQIALRHKPDHLIGLFNIGIAYRSIGKNDSARVFWEKYLQLAPNGSLAPRIRQLLTSL